MSEVLFLESPRHQRPPEALAYTVDTTLVGGTPTSVAVKLYSVTASGAKTDISGASSGARLVGSSSTAGNVITTPQVSSLVAGERYLLEVTFTSGGNTYSPATYIYGKP